MKEGKESYNRYEYWFAGLAGIPGRKKIRLGNRFPEVKELYERKNIETAEFSWLTKKERAALQEGQRKTESDLEREMAYCVEHGIRLAGWKDAAYPKRLKNIYDPPYALYYRGKLPENERRSAAVVGARNCSAYGKKAAEYIGGRLAEAGFSIVSGMASGIDGTGHWGALRARGSTYGVLGCGPDVCYPKENRALYEAILEQGGILSEYPPRTPPLSFQFPQRNRIISGLSDCVIVVEARERSGSLITADFALEQGKDVYAVPGRISDSLSRGTNRLLKQGAGVFLSVEDFLEELDVFAGAGAEEGKKPKLSLEKSEWLVYSCLDLTPKDMEELLDETGLDLMSLAERLDALREKGLILEPYRNYYIRSELEV